MGLAFKPGTDDLRDAPALDIIRELLAEGAEVSACDPVALRNARKAFEGVANISFCEDPYEAALGADAVVLATEWPQWANIDFGRLRQQVRNALFFDGRNFFNPDEVFKSGFQYLGVGR
ncbi:MAG TPA: UDP binding domain-containing protein [Thermosynergistes sp.]|nr:UDP binding domain-containing protein [Thermosynergistes sp.]